MTDRDASEDGAGGFVSRWSRRKTQARDSGATVPAPPPAAALAVPAPATPVAAQTQAVPAPAAPDEPAVPDAPAADRRPLPTMADVEKLTKDSDFSTFTARGVDAQVRNAALKKLFHGDPHFNVMDGLDIYIDDYNTSEPLPKAIMRQMLQARAMGLLDDELKEQDKPEPDLHDAGQVPADTRSPDEDADLQLQPDDAPGSEAHRAGAEPAADEPAADPGWDGDDDGGRASAEREPGSTN